MDKYNLLPKKNANQASPNFQGNPKNTVFLEKTAENEQIRGKSGAKTGKKQTFLTIKSQFQNDYAIDSSKKPLEKSKIPAYLVRTDVKSIGQNWSSGKYKIRSRIFHGFFYACDKIRCVMAGCIEEPSGSPFSLYDGKTNSVQPVTLQLVLKLTVSNSYKETAHV